jgi:hypothetical protein
MERPGPDRTDLPPYNFTKKPFGAENPGLSAFVLEEGSVYHTYPCYARGLDAFNASNQLLDRAPRGRDEDALPIPIAWLRRHDEYEDAASTASTERPSSPTVAPEPRSSARILAPGGVWQ